MKALTQYLDYLLHPTRVALWLLLVLGLGSLQQPSFAQNKDHPIHRSTRAETDSSHGYWRLKTLVKTRTTVVQFFAPNEQLIYQESLPEKWVKPTRRNRRQFDQLLKDLLANELVTTRIKTETLPTFVPERNLPVPRLKLTADEKQYDSPTEMPYTVHALVNQQGRLRLLVDSPLRQRYKIELADERGNLRYQEYNNIAQYRRWLDISALGMGLHILTVRIDGREIQYELNNRQVERIYQLAPLAVSRR